MSLAGVRAGDTDCGDVRTDRFYVLLKGEAAAGKVPISSLTGRTYSTVNRCMAEGRAALRELANY